MSQVSNVVPVRWQSLVTRQTSITPPRKLLDSSLALSTAGRGSAGALVDYPLAPYRSVLIWSSE